MIYLAREKRMRQNASKTEQTPLKVRPHSREHGRAIVMMIITLSASAILMLWGWNTAAVDLLHAPEARFVHALAFEASLIGVLLPFIGFFRLGRTA